MNVNLTIKEFHELSDRSTFSVVSSVCEEIANIGGKPFLVGGCVRDAIMGIRVSDFDIEVFGISLADLEKSLAKKFGIEKTGKTFGILKINGFPIDIAVPRSEIKLGNKHTDFRVSEVPDCDVATAASRRDFTINAIYFDFFCEKIVDEVGGISDLRSKTLRHVSDKFSEDPLRVLRGMQLCGRFELQASDDTLRLCKTLSIDGISKERIFWEWEKLLLKSAKPSLGLRFLKSADWLKFFPEIQLIDSCKQDPVRHPEGSVFEHTCLSLDALAGKRTGIHRDDIILGFATLCHDFGKPYVISEDEFGIHHYDHDEAGVIPSEKFLRSINFPDYLIEPVLSLVRWHMKPRDMYRYNMTDSAVLKLANEVGRLDLLLILCYVDFVGRTNWENRYDGTMEEWITSSAKRLGVFNKKPDPIMHGRDLIELGFSPSEKFSEILRDCFTAQMNCEIIDHSSGIEYLKRKYCS